MFLDIYCQNKTISAKSNIPHPYNLHDFGFAGNFVGFLGVKLIPTKFIFRKNVPEMNTYTVREPPGWKQWPFNSYRGEASSKTLAHRLSSTLGLSSVLTVLLVSFWRSLSHGLGMQNDTRSWSCGKICSLLYSKIYLVGADRKFKQKRIHYFALSNRKVFQVLKHHSS